MLVEVNAPEEFQGVVGGIVSFNFEKLFQEKTSLQKQSASFFQISKRNGIIQNSEGSEGWFTLTLEAPLNEMFGFASELRSVTQGKGEFSMEYSRLGK